MKRFGRWSGVEHRGGRVLVVFRNVCSHWQVMESEILRGLFQLPLRYTLDYLRHLSTFVCKFLLTYMPSRIYFSVVYPEYDLYRNVPGTK